jgi:ribosomal protein S18 acetylase RimI-like enzyme
VTASSGNIAKSVDPSADFVMTFAALCPDHGLRTECETDWQFLTQLFCACSPLAKLLPILLVEQQAQLQDLAFREEYPLASRWIVTSQDAPIGRIVIDWDVDGIVHGVDVAILPGRKNVGKGATLLLAWVAAADRLGRECRLTVLKNNRARLLYHRLGFRSVGDHDGANLNMIRPVNGQPMQY